MRTPDLIAWVTLGAGLSLGLTGLAAALPDRQEEPFPHVDHEGLFPLCTGCHEGVPTGNPEAFYPEVGSCDGCHDGVDRDSVLWSGPTQRVDNVTFDHLEHAADLVGAGDPAQECAACHGVPEGGRMAVADSVQLGTCFACHQHRADSHQVDGDCASCHVPLAESGFGVARIEALPTPDDHVAAAFLGGGHGVGLDETLGRCATCHTRERCVACHVDPARPQIEAMPDAPEGMELPVSVVHYNTPATHESFEWLSAHGEQASREACATCHTSDDCASCHVEPSPSAVRELPSATRSVAPGVGLIAQAPRTHESAFFMEAHPVIAVGSETTCSTCHQESFCVACHDAPTGGGYHPPSFVARHSADAFGRDTECATCHDAQVFCRECHVQAGLTNTAGRLSAGYHDGGPVWLLRHGQAARQSLESCASCHKQLDCTQCHGVLGAFKVSPHSESFDAARAWATSPRTCFACHIGNPLIGNQE